ncbi:MAG: hypothetical protein Q4F41_04015 [Eubacteriales bacterium]|nr:hypothetical protein [Eubacteriales bacterium]
MTELKVGAGKQKIEIPEAYLAVENFRTVHDPIHARAVVIEQEETIALVSLEITSMPEAETDAIRRLIAEKTGMKAGNVWVCVTHSFSSPHLLPDFMLKTEERIQLKEDYRQELQRAACEAAAEAYRNRRPAKMGMKTGTCEIVANRDVELPEGWWIGTKGPGLTDRTVSVLRFDDLLGKPIALVSHFAMQSSVLDQAELTGGGKPVSSDVAGNACRKVEEAYGNGAVALYLIGAAGDQAPVEKAVTETFREGGRIRTDLHEEGFAVCERLAKELGGKICEIADQISCNADAAPIRLCSETVRVPAKQMERDLHSLTPTRSFTYVEDGETETTIDGLRLGEIALLGVRPELNCRSAVSIMAMSDFRMTLVCTMVNGSAKYMADLESYDRFCYEAMNSPFGRGAAEIVSEKGIALLQKLKKERETGV